jgi:uncharacterized protein (DUF2141 family)
VKRVVFALFPLLSLAAAPVPSTPDLGIAEGRCRANEPGPAFLVTIDGLKDRAGRLKLEVYPSNDQDFLSDDNVLINAGKTFRRAEMTLPAQGNVEMCIRIPAAGAYSLSLLHDRDSNRKFGLSVDGIGFAGNPKLGWSKPKAAATRVIAGAGVNPISIRMNYRTGLLSFGPLRSQ